MINEKMDIVVYGRKLTVEMEGITEIELSALASELTARMEAIAKESQIVDSSKLAILTALECLAELSRLKGQADILKRVDEQSVEKMIVSLQNTLGKSE